LLVTRFWVSLSAGTRPRLSGPVSDQEVKGVTAPPPVAQPSASALPRLILRVLNLESSP
jgi:hypothetical protein